MASISRPTPDTVHHSVNNHVALITGAARGIGFATASLFAQHGARVVLVDLHEEDLKSACTKIGRQATYEVCDVSDWGQQEKLFHRVSNAIGPIHLLVCNAAVNPEISLLQRADPAQRMQMDSQVLYNYLADEPETGDPGSQLRRPSTNVFDINVNSVLFGLKLGVHHMKQQGGGRIVVVGSAASYLPVSSQPLYTASKHAVLGLVRSTSQVPEVIQSGISISWVAPWLTLTSMVEGLQATTQPHTLKSTADDVAWAIVAATLAKNSNGKGYWVQGKAISEVEGAYGEVAGRLIVPENRF
ncbi:hypothetical protein NUU61_008470 [Penicillium alfredii]|uniref:Uncharacterized protein n=1 Tax=Penicillium alfredii TaxID=1506179 RepID=A0A9W9ELH5_9EURO|nr:uncharacterized protein NUU61_008470 [Penicillium alfredii]KAJ5083891.1 hypothetical protein NUU61_008470 [Penicillium alfredii]